MKFWGTEVRPEQTVSCSVDNEHFIHISQAALGKTKKQSEKVVVSVKVDDTEVVIGTLSAENHPHFLCDLIFEKEFELSHSSKTASVFFSGYKAAMPDPFESSSNEEEDEEEPTKLAVANQVIDEEEPNKLPVLNLVSDKSKGKATANDGKKDKDEDDSDEDESGEDDSAESDDDSQFSSSDDMIEDETSSEEDDTSSKEDVSSSEEDVSSSEEDESDQEDAVIPKSENGKKRVAETALKTTASDKKAKVATPSGQKTGDKKGIHVATPYPTKQASKTASSKSMEKSPKSTGGSHVCKSCSKTFGTDSALQSHEKAKRLLNVSSEAAMKRSVRTINDFVYAVIDKKIEQMRKEQDEFARNEDILSRLLLEREKDPGCFDNKYLRDIILNFVVAGRDTTAGTMSWFLYVMCSNQHIQDKIAREVREITTGDRFADVQEFNACLTEGAISDMQYLHAALTEILRLYPAVPVDVKECFSDDTLPDGHAVRKGDMVNYQPYPMGRMKFLWGDDAEEFRPERWLDDDGVFVPESPFKFTAFQAGPRVCLGKEFAYRQMKIFAAVLLYLFRFELWEENSTVGYRPTLTLKMDGPLYLRALPRRRS